jgi:hypothetical protein
MLAALNLVSSISSCCSRTHSTRRNAPVSYERHTSLASKPLPCSYTARRISTSVLLNEHVDYERAEDRAGEEPPYVTERKIRIAVKHGWRPRLFLDELDKLAVSDFKIRRLGELVNAVYAVGGQVCATMNKNPEALAQKWTADEAETILRRIGGDVGAHTLYVG